jgi:predicted aminopeptidase
MQITVKQIRSKCSAFALLALLSSLLGGCTGYFLQAGVGQMRIAMGKQSIEKLLNQDELTVYEQQRLELSQAALAFAHEAMLLPDNGSYRSYYDTGQSYVVWNVFAAPEFSLQPRTWCFPVTGCVAYRGYFKAGSASKYAAKLEAKGDDVYVGGITAYSTLGRFHDPVLNTMLDMTESQFVGLLLHELAHQKLYIKDDSAFNEGFASAVEQEGLRRWNAARKSVPEPGEESFRELADAVLALLRQTRERLQRLYGSGIDEPAMRAQKNELLDELTFSYQRLVASWQIPNTRGVPYSRLFAKGWNNASVAAVATYDDYVPSFDALLQQCHRQLECFYEEAERVSQLEPDQRRTELNRLLSRSAVQTQKDLRQ